MVSARRAWSCHPAECDVITRGDEDYSCQETSCQDKLSRLQLSRGRPRQSVSKFAEAKADDDADTERLPPEPPTSPNSGYANESYNLRLRAWVDGSTLPHPYASLHSLRAWVDGSTLPHPYASIRAWVDDADTERLPPRHCIRPRERLPASEICPREHISDKENFSNFKPSPSSRTP